jgi:hypothetical protein
LGARCCARIGRSRCAIANASRIVQQCRQTLQSRHRGNRRHPNLPALARRPIEHPDGNLQPSVGRDTAQATAKRSPACLLDHIVNVNSSPRPRVPRVENLAPLGPVGVL